MLCTRPTNLDEETEDLECLVIEPAAEEVSQQLAELESCIDYWKQTPALLIIKPELAVVVSVMGFAYDQRGFVLHLGVQRRLVAPPGF